MKQFILSILILTSTSLYAQCQGDMNGDGIVNVIDIVASVNLILSGDNECEEESIYGCLDSQACNYDSGALIDNNSCYYCYNNDCDTYPEYEYNCDGNCIIEIDSCGECGGDDFNSEGYHCGDIQVVQDIVDINSNTYMDNYFSNCVDYSDPLFCEWEEGRLKTIFMSGNYLYSLTNLPESIGNLSGLHTLELENNNISELPESIGNLSSLLILELSGNSLTSLPESIGNLSSSQQVYLWNNSLSSLPETICNISYQANTFVGGNSLCDEYQFECITNDEWGTQDQSNCP